MQTFQHWLRVVVAWFRFRRKTSAKTSAEKPVPPPPEVPAPDPGEETVKLNRQMRRAKAKYERARRKYDKFVEPQGEPPIQLPPVPKAKKPSKPEVEEDEEIEDVNAKWMTIDNHHEGVDDKVLYEETELWGEFNFRDTILTQLDRYFHYIKRMRHYAPDEYDIYRQLGATLMPFHSLGMPNWRDDFSKKEDGFNKKHPKLPPAWLKNRPSFGCVAVATDPVYENIELNFRWDKDKKQRLWLPKFLYFRKYHLPPPEVQPLSGGDIYVLTVWWDKPLAKDIHRKYGSPSEIPILVSKEGEVTLLRECKTKKMLVHSRRRGDDFYIPQRAWRLPSNAVEAAKSWGTTPEIYTANLFQSIVQAIEFSGYSMIHVLVTNKEGLTARFGLNAKRIPYFFQDRDYALTDTGVRKKIFHVVRAHQRVDGSNVRLHFRGDRKFTWAGYDVEIIIPGKHRTDLQEFDLGMDDAYWHKDKKEKTVGAAKIAEWLAQPLKDGQDVPTLPNWGKE